MKNSVICVAIIALLSLYSCEKYDDYYGDYEYSTAYFANSSMDRSVIIDEYDYIQVGAVLGGKIENNRDEWVKYELVDSLVTNAGYEVLPADLYDVENNKLDGVTNVITIPQGSMLGLMKINLKAEFFSDPKAISSTYALAFRIVDASTDSIGNDVTIVTFKYVSNAVGIYDHKGIAISDVDTLSYGNEAVELTTNTPVGTNSVRSESVLIGSGKLVFDLTMDADNNIAFSSGDGSTIDITPVEDGFFDRENDHNIYLDYTFDYNGNTYHAQDTLVFVKRVIDNVIQWDTTYF
ncbi:BT_3987 domain-containing protein [Geofilum sp. OHC36d9]|uniref:BT_3987 domain-containing protein n=1 Tax=Geofilum sp. OHC36d9 TaxID=3458413 RepID=UPI0040334E46